MATGIVIRKISKLIETKDKDPAVLVIDEAKNFVISLLSGHLGWGKQASKRAGRKFGPFTYNYNKL